MENVAYDVIESYPFLPENHVWGEVKNPRTGISLFRINSTEYLDLLNY